MQNADGQVPRFAVTGDSGDSGGGLRAYLRGLSSSAAVSTFSGSTRLTPAPPHVTLPTGSSARVSSPLSLPTILGIDLSGKPPAIRAPRAARRLTTAPRRPCGTRREAPFAFGDEVLRAADAGPHARGQGHARGALHRRRSRRLPQAAQPHPPPRRRGPAVPPRRLRRPGARRLLRAAARAASPPPVRFARRDRGRALHVARALRMLREDASARAPAV